MPSTRSRTRAEHTDIDASASAIAALMRESHHVVFCTGAGISTNEPAALRDYRGPDGIWTEAQAAGLVEGEPGAKGMPVDAPWDASMFSRMASARPTFTHCAIAQLAGGDSPLVQHVITQNEDGLHRRSGLDASRLSEVHGCAFIELCGKYSSDSDSSDEDGSSSSGDDERADADAALKAIARKQRPAGCGAAVVRDFVTYWPETYRRSWPLGRHVTGRACPHCHSASTEAVSHAQGAHREATASAALNVVNRLIVGDCSSGSGVGDCSSGSSSVGSSSAGGDGGGCDRFVCKGSGWLVDSTVDFGESPDGFPWGANLVHNLKAAKFHMQRADLVVAWGTSLSILANYFDPWHKDSKWAKAPPKGLRLAAVKGDAGGATMKRRRAAVSRCQLVIINKGPTLDEDIAALKIEADVDEVAAALLRHLGLPNPPPYEGRTDPMLADVVPLAPGDPEPPWTITAALAINGNE